jgi:hypothetical protein
MRNARGRSIEEPVTLVRRHLPLWVNGALAVLAATVSVPLVLLFGLTLRGLSDCDGPICGFGFVAVVIIPGLLAVGLGLILAFARSLRAGGSGWLAALPLFLLLAGGGVLNILAVDTTDPSPWA